jgi:hypothetical protein
MKRINIDNAAGTVKQFVRSLPVGVEGIELELDGHVLFRVIPPEQLSATEKAALLEEGWELIRRSRERNKGVPGKVIEREVREAVKAVRRRQG